MCISPLFLEIASIGRVCTCRMGRPPRQRRRLQGQSFSLHFHLPLPFTKGQDDKLEEFPIAKVHAEDAFEFLDLAVGQDGAADVLRRDGDAVSVDAVRRHSVDGSDDVANVLDVLLWQRLQVQVRIEVNLDVGGRSRTAAVECKGRRGLEWRPRVHRMIARVVMECWTNLGPIRGKTFVAVTDVALHKYLR